MDEETTDECCSKQKELFHSLYCSTSYTGCTKVSQFRPDQFPKSKIWFILRKWYYLILWVCRTTANYHAVMHVNSHSHGLVPERLMGQTPPRIFIAQAEVPYRSALFRLLSQRSSDNAQFSAVSTSSLDVGIWSLPLTYPSFATASSCVLFPGSVHLEWGDEAVTITHSLQ